MNVDAQERKKCAFDNFIFFTKIFISNKSILKNVQIFWCQKHMARSAILCAVQYILTINLYINGRIHSDKRENRPKNTRMHSSRDNL